MKFIDQLNHERNPQGILEIFSLVDDLSYPPDSTITKP